MSNERNYSTLLLQNSFEKKFLYLKLDGKVADNTFGYERFLNQTFYRSSRWKRIRDKVIIRDNGCDLADPDHPIKGPIYIHHMNPITKEDIENETSTLLSPEYLVCVSQETHNAIHYGDYNLIKQKEYVERTPNDTCPWKTTRQ